jgi:hypothetical protein
VGATRPGATIIARLADGRLGLTVNDIEEQE